MSSGKTIVQIALSGGPCSGKSSAEPVIKKALESLGWGVIFIREAATKIIRQYGVNPPNLPRNQYLAFQEAIFRDQILAETNAREFAPKIKGKEKILIICDRGRPEVGAYMKPDDFTELLSKYRTDRVTIREGTYAGAIHLVTLADGFPELYLKQKDNNDVRFENTPSKALEADWRSMMSWLGHPHFRMIDNSTDFDGKMSRLVTQVKRMLGIPKSIETERKFLLANPPSAATLFENAISIRVRQTYLDDDAHTRIRLRTQDGEGIIYYKTQKIPKSEMSSIEHEHQINEMEYLELLDKADQDLEEIRKVRHHFVYKNQHFELDEFVAPKRLKGLWLLEIELTTEQDPVELPPWLGPVTEVTSDKHYKNRKLAKRP